MSTADTTPVILAAKRTAIGRFMGGFSNVAPTRLGSYVLEALFKEQPSTKDHVDECVMGCVLQCGLGQNPARQVGLGAGLPDTLSAQTINKVCGSGLQAVMLAGQSIRAGDNQLVIAGGIESMTRAPHYASLRAGLKFGRPTTPPASTRSPATTRTASRHAPTSSPPRPRERATSAPRSSR